MLDMDQAPAEMGMLPQGISPEEKLTRWLEERVFTKNIPGLTFVLKQKTRDGETNAVTWDADEIEGQDPSSIATMIYQAAEQDAQDQQAFTRYAVHAMRPGDLQSFTRCYFSVMPENADTAGADTEPGHLAEGHMAQAHRHAEVFARMMISQTAEWMHDAREEKRELRNAAARAVTQRIEMIDMYEKLQDRQLMRSIVLGRVKRKEEMKEKALGFVMQFLPDVLMKFDIMPGESKAQLETVNGLMNALCSIRPEQLPALMEELTPDQQTAVGGAYSRAKKTEANRIAKMQAENAKAITEGRPAPHQRTAAPEQPSAQSQPVVTPPPAQEAAPQAPKPAAVALTDQQVTALPAIANVFLATLADLPEKAYRAAIAKLNATERAAVEKFRAAVMKQKAAVKAAASEPAE